MGDSAGMQKQEVAGATVRPRLSAYLLAAPRWRVGRDDQQRRGGGGGDCQFVLGFAALHDMIPERVGDCLETAVHNPDNGDGLQQTTGGLLVWRKADNWTAFTNG